MTDPAEPLRIASATVPVDAGTSALTRTARIIARHLTAMADELDGGYYTEPGHPFIGEELPPDEVTPFMADLEPCGEDCQEHRLHVRGPGGKLFPVTAAPAAYLTVTGNITTAEGSDPLSTPALDHPHGSHAPGAVAFGTESDPQ